MVSDVVMMPQFVAHLPERDQRRWMVSAAVSSTVPKARAGAVLEVARLTGRHPETVRQWFRGARAPRRAEMEIAVRVLRQMPQLPVADSGMWTSTGVEELA